MKISKMALLFGLSLCFAVGTISAQKLKPEEIVAKHLDSVGTAEKRAALTSLIGVGDATVTFVTQKTAPAAGRIVMASAAEKNFFGLNLSAVDYPSEKFTYDGQKASVEIIRTSRSVLGNFIASNDWLLKDSLFGGTLATSWAMYDVTERRAKLSFDGMKQIDGREVYALSYSRRGGSDVSATLYFDKETFRHVRSEYKRTSSAAIGRTINESARQSESYLSLTENFGAFKEFEGITLPLEYGLVYKTTGQNGTTEIEWKFVLTEFAFNQALDGKTFEGD